MKLWLISQSENNNYDTFDSAVVAAASAEDAQQIHPEESWGYNVSAYYHEKKNYGCWAPPDYVKVKYIGESKDEETGVICASFNAR